MAHGVESVKRNYAIQCLLIGTEQAYETPDLLRPVSEQGFEVETSRTLIKSINHSTSKCFWYLLKTTKPSIQFRSFAV